MTKFIRFRLRSVWKIIVAMFLVVLIHHLFIQNVKTSKINKYRENSVPNVATKVVSYVHPKCNCVKGVMSSNLKLNSTCPNADFRGAHQKVISYSFYGSTSSGYFKGVAVNTDSVSVLYPGWTVRLYHNIQPTDERGMEDLCREVCRFPHLDECFVGEITGFSNLEQKFGMLWRFLVLGDPSVDIFGVRDLDSPVYQREVDAVADWMTSPYTWHVMRDNGAHITQILGGMWGGRNVKMPFMNKLAHQLIEESRSHGKTSDQYLLSKIIWPVAKDDMVSHDSYLCTYYPNTRPWPTQRVNMTFVGDMYGLFITKPCPKECRPQQHPDWEYC